MVISRGKISQNGAWWDIKQCYRTDKATIMGKLSNDPPKDQSLDLI
ncbi:hypothetical protein [Moraxella porci]|nr:hypothetical protein [Moraxella porci]MDH2273656.1 hypothetical protein [Moraxella porci]